MKNSGRIFSSFLLLCTIVSCENPIKDVQLKFKEPIQYALLELRVLNYKYKAPENVNIEVLGRNKDAVVNTLKIQKFRLNSEGSVVFAINPEIVPSTSEPIAYSIVLKAPGYIPAVVAVKFTSRNNQSKTIFLGLENEVENNQVVGNIETIKTEGQQLKSFTLNKSAISQINIPADFNAKTVDGDALNIKETQLSVLSFDNTKKTFLPTDGLAQNPVNDIGQKLNNPFKINTLGGFANIQVFDKAGQIGHSFSKPLLLSIYLNTSTVNPRTGKPIKLNDQIDIFRFDDYTNVWTKYASEKILSINNQFYLQISPKLAGVWIAAWAADLCSEGPSFQIKSTYAKVDINYLYQILDNSTNRVLREFYWPINTSTNYTIRNIEFNENKLKLRILNKSDFRGGDGKILAESKPLNTCEKSSNTIDLMALKIADPIKVKFEVICPDGEILDEKLIPLEMRTQIRISGEENWKYLGTFTRTTREIESYKLILKSTYDFRLSTDGGVSWPYVQSDFKVNVKNWTIQIDASGYCK